MVFPKLRKRDVAIDKINYNQGRLIKAINPELLRLNVKDFLEDYQDDFDEACFDLQKQEKEDNAVVHFDSPANRKKRKMGRKRPQAPQ